MSSIKQPKKNGALEAELDTVRYKIEKKYINNDRIYFFFFIKAIIFLSINKRPDIINKAEEED